MITLKRDSGWADRLCAYKVVLDGNVVGEIGNGELFQLDVPKGKHSLNLRIDRCGSNIVEFTTDGNTVGFECGNSLRGFKLFFAVLYVTFS
jgi:hypothetical protein